MSRLKEYVRTLALLSMVSTISGCQNSADTCDAGAGVFSVDGDPFQFYDLPVSGLSYFNGTNSSVTDETGTFFWDGESEIQFSIGEVDLGYLYEGDKAGIKPIADNGGPNVRTNLLRLLMTIDEDQDASNGIEIPCALRDATGEADFTADFEDFGGQAAVISMIGDKPLLAAEEAEGTYTKVLFQDYVGSYELLWAFLIEGIFPVAGPIAFDIGEDGTLHTGDTVINASVDPHDDYRLRLSDLSFLVLLEFGYYQLDIDANIEPDRTVNGKAIARSYNKDDGEGVVVGAAVDETSAE